MLPDRGAKALALVGIVDIQPQFTTGGSRLACLVEALLGGIPAVGMERRRPTGAVLQVLAALLGKPDALLAVAPIVLHKRVRIDAPAFRVEGIGLRFGKGREQANWVVVSIWRA